MKRRRARNKITLIELLLVILLIGVMGSLLSWSVPRVLEKERFESAVARLREEILTAEEQMLFGKGEVRLTLSQETDGLHALFEGRGSAHTLLLPKVHKIALDGVVERTVVLSFSEGTVPLAALTLYGKGSAEHTLHLKGFPGRL